MAFRDSWHRALVYFGLAEERDPYVEEDEPYEPEAELEDRYRERPNVRRLGSRRRRDEFDDIFADDDVPAAPTAQLRSVRPAATAAATCACTSSSPRASTTPSRSRQVQGRRSRWS
jgi:cell division inhibitor SepF